MPRLSEGDFQGVLTVLREAGEVEGPAPFPEPVLDALRRLVRCDVASYHEQLGRPAVMYVGEPCSGNADIGVAYARFWRQDRLLPALGARKISDFLTRREFQRTELYESVYRPLGIADTMRIWLDPGRSDAHVELDRPRRDFSERDRDVLDALLPHLTQFRRHAARRRTPPPADTASELTRRERQILDLVAQGKTNAEIAALLWISPLTVRKHLENVFAKLGVHTRTAAVAAGTVPYFRA